MPVEDQGGEYSAVKHTRNHNSNYAVFIYLFILFLIKAKGRKSHLHRTKNY